MKAAIKKKYGQDATVVSDEGGFVANIKEHGAGLELLNSIITKSGYMGRAVTGLDVVASEIYGSYKTYKLNSKEESDDGSLEISSDEVKYLYKLRIIILLASELQSTSLILGTMIISSKGGLS